VQPDTVAEHAGPHHEVLLGRPGLFLVYFYNGLDDIGKMAGQFTDFALNVSVHFRRYVHILSRNLQLHLHTPDC